MDDAADFAYLRDIFQKKGKKGFFIRVQKTCVFDGGTMYPSGIDTTGRAW